MNNLRDPQYRRRWRLATQANFLSTAYIQRNIETLIQQAEALFEHPIESPTIRVVFDNTTPLAKVSCTPVFIPEETLFQRIPPAQINLDFNCGYDGQYEASLPGVELSWVLWATNKNAEEDRALLTALGHRKVITTTYAQITCEVPQ